MFIIQTNISIDNKGIERDFQSMVYEIKDKTWKEFKEYILNDEYETVLIFGTMKGSLKPREIKVNEVLINDHFHLQVRFSNNIESKYYLVKDEEFYDLRR